MNGNVSIEYVILDHVYSEVSGENEKETDGVSKESRSEADLKPDVQKDGVLPVVGKICTICKKILPPDANLSFHRMLHPWTDKPYSCDYCLFVSMTREELTEHCKETHPEKRKFVCKVCGRVFTNIRTLNKHKPLHAPKLPFSCCYCDKGFPEYVNWRLHEVAHKSARFECVECLVRFTTMKGYNEHFDGEDCKSKILECCEQVFSTRSHYVDHCLTKHRMKDRVEYSCEFCGKIYPFKYHINLHKSRCRFRTDKYKPDSISKPENNAETDNGQVITMAIAGPLSAASCATRIPVIKEKEKTNEKIYDCDKCDRKFRTKAWLSQHKRKHLQGCWMSCTLCDKKYSSYAALYYHRQSIHLQLRRFKCSVCAKAFVSGQSLRDHMTSHTGEQPHACHLCPKKFRHRSSKNEHLRTHTGERPYKCEYCDQRFKRRHAKVSHERRHTGEKPFKCRVCDRCFTQDSTWRSHERKHKAPFTCNHCSMIFSSVEMLATHKDTHGQSEEVPVEQVCFVMEENATVETVEDGTVYVHYQHE